MVAQTLPENTASTGTSKFREDFTKALDLSAYEKVNAWASMKLLGHEDVAARNIISARTPDQIIDAFSAAKPEWKGAMDQIKADPELAKAMHNSLIKDPTMIKGFGDWAAESGAVNPQELQQSLSDPTNRKIMTQVLNKVADKEDVTFKDFRELYDVRNDRGAAARKLTSIGVDPMQAVSANDFFEGFAQMMKDPKGFFLGLSASLGLNGAQGQAMNQLAEFAGKFVEFIVGGDGGVRDYYNKHGSTFREKGNDAIKFVKDISGETDKEASAASRRETGPSTTEEFNTAARGDRATAPAPAPEQAPAPQRPAPSVVPTYGP